VDEEENAFEMLYSDFKGEMTKEDLDTILKFLLDLNSKILLARLAILIPFAVFTYQVLQYFKTFSMNYYIIGSVLIMIVWVLFGLDFINYVNKFKSMKYFKDYFNVRIKMKNIKDARAASQA